MEELRPHGVPRPPAGKPSRSLPAALGLLALLAATNVLVHVIIPSWAYVPAILAASVLAVLVARQGGATVEDLGLATSRARHSLLIGLGIGGIIAAVVFAGLAVPPVRDLYVDDRAADLGVGGLVCQVLVRIPLGTAAGEELLFRSAALGLGLRCWSRARAVISSAALFGLWHILPALQSHASNSAATAVPTAVVVVVTVGVTGLAGVGFAWLRLRTGHVAAPVIAHAVLNASALAAAYLVTV